MYGARPHLRPRGRPRGRSVSSFLSLQLLTPSWCPECAHETRVRRGEWIHGSVLRLLAPANPEWERCTGAAPSHGTERRSWHLPRTRLPETEKEDVVSSFSPKLEGPRPHFPGDVSRTAVWSSPSSSPSSPSPSSSPPPSRPLPRASSPPSLSIRLPRAESAELPLRLPRTRSGLKRASPRLRPGRTAT